MKTRIFALSALLLIAACTRLTQENFSRIEAGMSEQEVLSILGLEGATHGYRHA